MPFCSADEIGFGNYIPEREMREALSPLLFKVEFHR